MLVIFNFIFNIVDTEDKKALKEVLELSRENSKILHKMKRAAFLNKLVRVLYWVVIVGSAVSLYYYMQPLFEQLIRTYTDLLGTVEQVKGATGTVNQLGQNLNGISSGGISPELLYKFEGLLGQ